MTGMYNKQNRIKNTLRCIASAILAVLLIVEPSMLVFAEAGAAEPDSGGREGTVQSEENEQPIQQRELNENKTESEIADGHSIAENEENGEKEEQSPVEDKDEVRDVLQPGSGKKSSAQSLKAAPEDEDAEDPLEEITVTVIIRNETYPCGPGEDGKPRYGTLLDTKVTVPSDFTMMQALHKACQDNDIPSVGTDGSYVSMIANLREFDGGGGSGWMGTLNDWFTNTGFDQVALHEGDVICIEYSRELGEDLGSSFTRKDKRIKAITTSVGELTPEFDSDFKEYNLIISEDTDEVAIYTTAVNRNYLVKSIVGGVEYNRGENIPVRDGTIISVRCGDLSWPSMNSYGQEDTVKPETYRINVYKGNPSFLVDVSGDNCIIEPDKESGLYAAGEKVTVSLRYNTGRYQLAEEGVRAYVGGSSKYIQITEEENGKYTFTMPGNDVEVRAKCETRYDYPLAVTGSLKNCYLSLDHKDGKYCRGNEVTFTLTPETGKRINDLSVKAVGAESEAVLELKHISQDKYSFIMPGEDVVIYAESEDKTKNGLNGYKITTRYGDVTNELTDESRTSICTLPDRASIFDLSLDIDESEELISVRVRNVFGDITAYTEPEITGISAGTRNTALFGKEITVSVITKDEERRTRTYTIRIKTQKSETEAGLPDAEIIPYRGVGDMLPYKKTLMTSGVTLYEVDYPTEVEEFCAQRAFVWLTVFPTYEEDAESIEIRCKYAEFTFINGYHGLAQDSKWYYQSNISLQVWDGPTPLEVPVEIDYTLASGEKVTKKYLYRITNGRFARQRFRILSSKGNPITPTSFILDGNNVSINDLKFEDGNFTLDVLPGEHVASSMRKTAAFTVEDDLSRPIQTEVVTIETDTPEYTLKVKCSDKDAVFTLSEVNTGFVYAVKSDMTEYSLPPGKYQIKAINDTYHLFSKNVFTVSASDVNVTMDSPAYFDPEFVAGELDLLEEIQVFDAGDGLLEIYVPEYQERDIVVTPVIVSDPDNVGMTWREFSQHGSGIDFRVKKYYVQRDELKHSLYLKYNVYNTNYPSDIFTTDEMELYMPSFFGNEDDVVMPADVRILRIGFGIEDGSAITGIGASSDEYYNFHIYGKGIPVVEETSGLTEAQLQKAGYKIKYTMRYAETEVDEMENVWCDHHTLYGAYYHHDNDHECEIFETQELFDSGHMVINPDISDWGSYAEQSVNGWYEVTAWFEDLLGQKSMSKTITVYKDGQPPRATVYVDSEKGVYQDKQTSPEYSNKPVTVRIAARDYGLGLHSQPYSYDAGETWTSEDHITFTESGSIDMNDIWVRDSMGNITAVIGTRFDTYMHGSSTGQRYTGASWFAANMGPRWEEGDQGSRFIYVDMEKPSLAVVSDYSSESNILDLTVRASDNRSGLAAEAYSFDGGETWQQSNKYTVELGEYSAGNIRVRDKAGNIAVYDEEYVWTRDSFAGDGPIIKAVNIEYGEGGGTGYDGRKWYKSAVLTIEAEAGSSDIARYSLNGTSYSTSPEFMISVPMMISAGSISITDKAGNTVVYDKDVDITNIDTHKPEVSVTFAGNSGTVTREITARITASDQGSKCIEYAISPIPLDEYVTGYPIGEINLKWTDSDDEQFKISDLGRKYDHVWLEDAGERISGLMNHGGTLGLKWGIRLYAKDAAGNIGYYDTWCWGGYIDQEGPEISEVTTEYKRFNDESGIVRVYVAATEPKGGSGLALKAYSFDGGKTWQASNSISIPVGASIPAGQIRVRDVFGNVSVYNRVVKTTLQDIIARINRLDPETAKNKDFKEILDLFNQLSDREKSKVYNWQDFLDMLGNRKDQDWDDDFGDIGEPDDGGEQGGDQPDPDDPGDDQEGDGEDDGGAGEDDGKPSDGSGNGRGGGKPEARDADGGNDTDTVSVALSNTSTSNTPDVKTKTGQNYREAEIEKKGAGGMLSQGMVKLWELILLIIIIGGAYTYGAQKRYRRYRDDAA